MRSMSLVGLDVHAAQTHAAILNTETGELRGVKLRLSPIEVVSFLRSLPGPVQAVYEAGPTGFGLAREAKLCGIDVQVVAARPTPQARRRRRDRLRPRTGRVLLGGRHPLTPTPTTTARPVLPGRARDTTGHSSSHATVRDAAMGNHQPSGRWPRPLLDRGPRRTQGHEVSSPRISAWQRHRHADPALAPPREPRLDQQTQHTHSGANSPRPLTSRPPYQRRAVDAG
jgi:hypothetical protein